MTRCHPDELTAVEVVTHGRLPAPVVGYARGKILELARYTPAPILHARIGLTVSADPAVPLPAQAQAVLDVNGRPLRGHAVAASPRQAVDLLQSRLRRRLSRMAPRREVRGPGRDDPGPAQSLYPRPRSRS